MKNNFCYEGAKINKLETYISNILNSNHFYLERRNFNYCILSRKCSIKTAYLIGYPCGFVCSNNQKGWTCVVFRFSRI